MSRLSVSGIVEKRRLWGLLWGPHIHLGESRRNSNQLATTTEPVEPERVAGFSAFRSTSYFFVRNGLRNQSTPLDSSRARRCIHPLAGALPTKGPGSDPGHRALP